MRDPGRRIRPLAVVGVVLAAVGGVLGLTLVQRPEVVVPLTLEVLFLAGVTWLLVARVREREARGWLLRLGLGALAIRFLVFFVVHFVLDPYFFAPDAFGYEREGAEIARRWMGVGEVAAGGGDTLLPTYAHLNALFHLVLENSSTALVVFNIFAGVWTSLLTFHLGRETMGERVGKVSSVLVAFFPSLVLWSVLNIRDALSTFVVVTALLFGVRVFRRARPSHLVVLLVALVALSALRDYMGFLVTAGLIVGWGVALRPGQVPSTLVAGTVLVAFVAFLGEEIGLFQTVTFDEPLETAERLRRSLQQGATSAYGVDFDTSTLGGAIRFIPYGFVFLLFAPFPWAVETTLQMAAVPETLLWYPTFALFVVGLFRAVREGTSVIYVPFAVLLVVSTSYALVEGNFGTAYRHRAQVMPLFFLFSAAGILIVKARILDLVLGPGRRFRAPRPLRPSRPLR